MIDAKEKLPRHLSVIASASIIAQLMANTRSLKSVDAVVALYGQGELERVKDAMRVAQCLHAKHLIVIGCSLGDAETYGLPDTAWLESLATTVRTPYMHPCFQCILVPTALHTQDHVFQALEQLAKVEAKTALLVATGWHLVPRAYLTFVAEALRHPYGSHVQVWPYPAERALGDRQEAVPGMWTNVYGNVFDAVIGEAGRSMAYEDDVADFERLREYILTRKLI